MDPSRGRGSHCEEVLCPNFSWSSLTGSSARTTRGQMGAHAAGASTPTQLCLKALGCKDEMSLSFSLIVSLSFSSTACEKT